MNLTKKTILALGLVVAGVSYAQTAQTASTSSQPVGLLGQSYSQFSYGVTDIHNFSKDQQNLGVAGNIPVLPYLDLGASYGYSWLRGIGHTNTIAGGATAYTTWSGVKPFVGAAVGYQWDRSFGARDDEGIWGLAAGVEVPVSVITLTPQVVYGDDFRRSGESSQHWTYSVEGNYWLSHSTALFASVGYIDENHTSAHAWDYEIGARFRF